jgi:hypothetical protein
MKDTTATKEKCLEPLFYTFVPFLSVVAESLKLRPVWVRKQENPVFWGCARGLVQINEDQKPGDQHCWAGKFAMALYVGTKWVSGGYFNRIDPRKAGLKEVVMGLFLQTKGVFQDSQIVNESDSPIGDGRTIACICISAFTWAHCC